MSKVSHISLVGQGVTMRVELLINLIAPGIIIPLGTFGNCLALWTLFFSKLLQKRVVSIFLITIFLADISTNVTIYMARWFVNLARMNLTEIYENHTITYIEGSVKGIQHIEIDCQCHGIDIFVILFMLEYASATVSAYTMAALTIERVLVVFKPMLNQTQKHEKSVVVLTILCIVTLSFFTFLPLVLKKTILVWDPETGNLSLDDAYEVWSFSICILCSYVIILPANIALVIKLHKEHKCRK